MYILQANTLHWTCIKKFPNIYHSTLWPDMKKALDVIKAGMQVQFNANYLNMPCSSDAPINDFIDNPNTQYLKF